MLLVRVPDYTGTSPSVSVPLRIIIPVCSYVYILHAEDKKKKKGLEGDKNEALFT